MIPLPVCSAICKKSRTLFLKRVRAQTGDIKQALLLKQVIG